MTEAPDIKTLVDEIEAGLEGVTPGPWVYEGETTPYVTSPLGAPDVCDLYHRGQSGALFVKPDADENGPHIARCSPDNMRTIIAHVRALEAERRALRQALSSIRSHRQDCWDYDDDIHGCRREFQDKEEWRKVEQIARAALNQGGGDG